MDYYDPVYGSTEITEPLLLELMASNTMQRTRRVLQHGITGLLGITRPTTRFEHSLGAFILVRRLGGGLEEQIAALLHDASHTAFSHVIDYVFHGHDSQSYHEEKKEVFLANSDIPAVLQKHGYDWHNLLHEERYPLLEQPAPALCADRLDYFLRDARDLGLATAAQVEAALAHLVVQQGRIAVDDLATALWMGCTYIAADQASWANFREVALYEVTAQAIRTALQIGVITEADLWGTDEVLWNKISAYPDPTLQSQVRLVSPETQFVWDETNPTFRISTKLRTIDPDVWVNGSFQPLSVMDIAFAEYRTQYLHSKSGRWPIRVV